MRGRCGWRGSAPARRWGAGRSVPAYPDRCAVTLGPSGQVRPVSRAHLARRRREGRWFAARPRPSSADRDSGAVHGPDVPPAGEVWTCARCVGGDRAAGRCWAGGLPQRPAGALSCRLPPRQVAGTLRILVRRTVSWRGGRCTVSLTKAGLRLVGKRQGSRGQSCSAGWNDCLPCAAHSEMGGVRRALMSAVTCVPSFADEGQVAHSEFRGGVAQQQVGFSIGKDVAGGLCVGRAELLVG